MKEEKSLTVYELLKSWKLHVSILLCCMISDKIGNIVIPLFGSVTIVLMPLLYAMALVTILYLIKPIKWISEKEVPLANNMLNTSFLLLAGYYGVLVAANYEAVIGASLPLLVQNIGDGFTCLIALPIAVLAFKMKRESVGITYANSREPGIALIEGKYGAESEEFRGVVGMYIVGTVFGPLVVSLLTSFFGTTGIFNKVSIAMAGGVGSSAMSSAAIGAMATIWPEDIESLTAFCSTSNLLSALIGTYLSIFLALPLANWLYKLCTKGKKSNAT